MHHTPRVLAVLATALAVAATTAHAQAAPAGVTLTSLCGPGTPDPDCKGLARQPSILLGGLELTKTQQDSVDAISRRYRALHGQLYAQRLPVDAHNAQVMALRTREVAEKRKVMTPAQLPRFDANADSLRKLDEQMIAEAKKQAAERQKEAGRTPPQL